MAQETADASLGAAIRGLGDSLSKLLSEHVALLEIELKREGTRLATAAVLVGGGLLLCCVGYLVLMGALVASLGPVLGVPLGATLVGIVNLIIGTGVVLVAVRRLRNGVSKLDSRNVSLEEGVFETPDGLAASRGQSAQ
jgi:hypothetical protein